MEYVLSKRAIQNLMQSKPSLIVDGEALCDALHYMYFLAKHEISHTKFAHLHDLCVMIHSYTPMSSEKKECKL